MYNTIIAEFDSKLKIQEYSRAYQLYELKYGSSSGRTWKAAVFFVCGLMVLYALGMENFDFGRFPAAAVVLLICMYMVTYYACLVPKKAKLHGEHIYKSSKLLSKPKHFIISRDCFSMQNDYESLKRFYTDITDCIETDTDFILIGGVEHSLTVISKKQISQQQIQDISRHFQREMPKQYKRT